jgi:hypothetical protein
MSLDNTLNFDDERKAHSAPQEDEAHSRLPDSIEEEQAGSAVEDARVRHTKDGILEASPGKCKECMKPLMKNFFPCGLAPAQPVVGTRRECSLYGMH